MWSQSGYNEYDFMRMKQDAISRAKEMQNRAVMPSASINNDTGGWQSGQPAQQPVREQRCPRCGRIIRDGKHVYPPREPPIFQNNRPTNPSNRQAAQDNRQRAQSNTPSNRQSTGTGQSTPPNRSTTRGAAPNAQRGRRFTYESPQTEAKVRGNAPPVEEFVNEPPPAIDHDEETFSNKINIPFLGEIEIDRDFLIIGGVLLVLLTEKGDQMLMLALLYIML